MSESIWWPDDAWWERKSLPLGFITLSLRQLITVAVSFIAAFAISLPFQFPIAGFSFAGRASVFCLIFGIGYGISIRRVRMLPVELQALYLLRTRGIGRLRGEIRSHLSRKRGVNEPRPSPIILRMLVEDFRNPVPLVLSDRVKDVADDTRVLLLLDGHVRVEELVSPRNSRYRLAYVPLPQDIGEHTLTVKLADSSEPLTTIGLSLAGRSQDTSSPTPKEK
jgi:hypothetical protein